MPLWPFGKKKKKKKVKKTKAFSAFQAAKTLEQRKKILQSFLKGQ